MARFVTGKTFGATETVTAALLNQAVNDAAISTDSVDGSTIEVDSNALRLKDSASTITGVTTAKIANNAVTLAKMATQADQTVLGNVSGGTAVPTAVPIVGTSGVLKNDDALGTSDTQGATQGNIKAYVDQDKCLVTSATSSITIGSVPLAVPFNSEISDTSGLHDNSTNNSRITIASAGIYLINATVATTETNNGDGSIAIYKNGSELTRIYLDSSSTSSGQVFNITHIASLSATDYLEIFVVAISGDSTGVNGTKSFFSVAGLV
jgi:hypothetical protein